MDLKTLVHDMKIKDKQDKNYLINQIKNQTTLTAKCVLARNYLSPQSTELEAICKQDLKISEPLNETSGDGRKNGIHYEIKTSVHANKSRINFVQIRPDHDIHYYIFIAYNMYTDDEVGKGYIFKIPANDVYDLVTRFGGYAHGTKRILGEIAIDNMTGRNCEYYLRCDPNAKKGKSYDLWQEFMKYEVDYNTENF